MGLASRAAGDSASKKPRARRKKKTSRKKDLFSTNGDDLDDQDGGRWNFLAPADEQQVNDEERSTKCDTRSERLPNHPNRSEEKCASPPKDVIANGGGHTVEVPKNEMAKVIGILHRNDRSPKQMLDLSEPAISNPLPTESAGEGNEREKSLSSDAEKRATEVAVAIMGGVQTASSPTCKVQPSQLESTEYDEVERSEEKNTDRIDQSKRQSGRDRQVVSTARVLDKAQPRGSRERRIKKSSSQQNAAGDKPEIYSRVKTRKRGKSMNGVRIMFTGIESDKTNIKWIDDIGAELVESIKDANTVTHVIVSDGKRISMRRTPKLMICLCNTSNVVSLQWLEQSAKKQTVLDTEPFLWLNDKKAQKAYNFDMEATLYNGTLARKKRGGLLGGWCVYICQGVAGNKCESRSYISSILSTWLS